MCPHGVQKMSKQGEEAEAVQQDGEEELEESGERGEGHCREYRIRRQEAHVRLSLHPHLTVAQDRWWTKGKKGSVQSILGNEERIVQPWINAKGGLLVFGVNFFLHPEGWSQRNEAPF